MPEDQIFVKMKDKICMIVIEISVIAHSFDIQNIFGRTHNYGERVYDVRKEYIIWCRDFTLKVIVNCQRSPAAHKQMNDHNMSREVISRNFMTIAK